MKPLVSGVDARRYVEPRPTIHILFPYTRTGEEVQILDAVDFQRRYPCAWSYLQSYAVELKRREVTLDNGGNIIEAPFDDERWYRFGRHQNIDKQDIPKLMVPRLVNRLVSAVDTCGLYYLDNVDVGGVQPADDIDLFFLAGLLNSKVLNFVFQRISKPFRGNYLSANKQFIAPLPVPTATAEQAADIAALARQLQASHTLRRDILARLARRMETVRRRPKPETWLFPDLKSKRELEAEAPATLDADGRRAWATKRYDDVLGGIHGAIKERLHPSATLDAVFVDGELSFLIDGVTIIDRIFVTDAEGSFILAQWKVLAATFSITARTTGERLCNALRRLAGNDHSPVIQQIMELERELATAETTILRQEREMDAAVYALYSLSDDEIELVENG